MKTNLQPADISVSRSNTCFRACLGEECSTQYRHERTQVSRDLRLVVVVKAPQMRLLIYCFFQRLLPRRLPPVSPVFCPKTPALSSISVPRLSPESAPPPPPCSLLLRAVSMSPPTSYASDNKASLREKAARAAERRRQASTTAAAPRSSSESFTLEPAATSATAAAAAANACSPPEGDLRKRRGSPASRPSIQQIGFSDSDGSESEAIVAVGTSDRPVTLIDGRGRKDCTARDTPAVEGSRGRAAASGSNKRRRMETTSGTSEDVGATAAHTAFGSGQSRQKGGATLAPGSSSGSSSHASKTFRVVSWNIDCLNGENKMARAEEVCAILQESEPTPDVILLQEVDGDMFPVLNTRLGAGGRYRAYPTNVPVGSRYFTIMFVKVCTVTVHNSGREDFPDSRMGRDLATVRAFFNGKPILIATSHLESEKQSSDERKAQFNRVLRRLLAFSEGPAIFAGDTNLREAEVKQEKLAKEAGDVWQLCGADPERRFTWDMAKNDNHVFGGGFQPRARYDRMFVNTEAKDGATSFALLGTERMAPPHSCFPSDHFGLDACFEW